MSEFKVGDRVQLEGAPIDLDKWEWMRAYKSGFGVYVEVDADDVRDLIAECRASRAEIEALRGRDDALRDVLDLLAEARITVMRLLSSALVEKANSP